MVGRPALEVGDDVLGIDTSTAPDHTAVAAAVRPLQKISWGIVVG
jgi:hypothetical protein